MSSEAQEQELAARKRVAALVAGGVSFKLKRQGEQVQAARNAGAMKVAGRLASKLFAPEQTLDLRERTPVEIGDAVAAFLGVVHRRGVKHVLVRFAQVPAAEEDGHEVRAQALIDALTRGPASPLVRAFASAHETFGGSSAIAVMLI